MLLCIVVAVYVRLEYKDDSTMGLHPFMIGQNMVTARKALHARSKHYNLVVGGIGTTMANEFQMSAPDGVDLTKKLRMTQETWSAPAWCCPSYLVTIMIM